METADSCFRLRFVRRRRLILISPRRRLRRRQLILVSAPNFGFRLRGDEQTRRRKSLSLRTLANRATLPQKWPPPPRNVAGSCELNERSRLFLVAEWLERRAVLPRCPTNAISPAVLGDEG